MSKQESQKQETQASDSPEAKLWFVYLVHTAKSTLYTGIATDVERRFLEHLDAFNGKPAAKGAKYFRYTEPLEVVLVESYPNRSEASKREAAIKAMTRAQKDKLVAEGTAVVPQAKAHQ